MKLFPVGKEVFQSDGELFWNATCLTFTEEGDVVQYSSILSDAEYGQCGLFLTVEKGALWWSGLGLCNEFFLHVAKAGTGTLSFGLSKAGAEGLIPCSFSNSRPLEQFPFTSRYLGLVPVYRRADSRCLRHTASRCLEGCLLGHWAQLSSITTILIIMHNNDSNSPSDEWHWLKLQSRKSKAGE